MSPTTYFSPEEIHRMTAVYERAVQELNLERAPGHERDRLAVYVLSIGNIQDPNQMLDRAVRYLTEDCCQGQPELCGSIVKKVRTVFKSKGGSK